MSRKSSFNWENAVWVVLSFDDEVVNVEIDGENVKTVPRFLFSERLAENDVFSVKCERVDEKVTFTFNVDSELKQARLTKSRQQVAYKSDWDKGGDVVL